MLIGSRLNFKTFSFVNPVDCTKYFFICTKKKQKHSSNGFRSVVSTHLLERGGVFPVEVADQLPVVQVALENHQRGFSAQLLVQFRGVVLHFVEGPAEGVEAD